LIYYSFTKFIIFLNNYSIIKIHNNLLTF
jgi:hypothetical protein